ncbi:NAD(P)H-hydrate dehydratase [Magnetofaba australis]|uniref:Bifunctional NAD(P)H-hydrate repair enzyme n=1 Tax=Magnetofaba australis IT-1 TaxID=1434232 RepID=A0A1Y2KAN7_9PROT|nr:NAD(P)H-hydrate dehydratase [Magnetofaba australis]OSM06875.1 putative carbohydrate kinase [Magnetofaba australis IT-1]
MPPLLTAAQMSAADRKTIERIGLPGAVLMENAGAACVEILLARLPELATGRGRVLILAGRGNNGGDGFVIARRLMQAGAGVTLWLFGELDHLRGDAALHAQVFVNLGGTVRTIADAADIEAGRGALSHATAVVDAVFGTGLQRPVSGIIASAFEQVIASGKPVLAVDIPSGVSADDGSILGTALPARWTVTFAAKKIGHVAHPGAALCGETTCAPIGIPDDLLTIAEHTVAENTLADLNPPARLQAGHKGSFGHLLIVGGSPGKAGAPALTALGAQRMGPGLLSIAAPRGVRPEAAQFCPEAMTLNLPESESGEIGAAPWEAIAASGIKPAGLAMGPGLGQGEATAAAVLGLLARYDIPTVADADALNALAREPIALAQVLEQRRAPLILTPHPGEMARLINKEVASVQAARLPLARETAQRWGVWLLLKGAGSVIAAPDGRVWINSTGNHGLAAGGSGDLLTGIVAGLLSQGWSAEQALRAGVYWHGRAADLVAEKRGAAGLAARDLLPELQRLRNGVAE